MSKLKHFSNEFIGKITSLHLIGKISYSKLSQAYDVSPSAISTWCKGVDRLGLDEFLVQRKLSRIHKSKSYSQKFKIAVVLYIRSHNITFERAAILFNIRESEAHTWCRIVQYEGVVGLRQKPKGELTMSKHQKNNLPKHLELSKEQEYKKENEELKHELYEARMDIDILKALTTAKEKQRSLYLHKLDQKLLTRCGRNTH